MYRTACLLLLASSVGVYAEEAVVTLPKDIKTAPGRLVRISASSEGKVIRWASTEDCDLIPFPDGRLAIFSAQKPGTYRVLAWTAKGDMPSEAAVCTIVVEGVPPTPVPPGPTPPEDPFRLAVRRAFQQERSDARSSHARALADFYKRVAPGVATDNSLQKLSDLQSNLRQRNVLSSDALPLVRQVIAEEFKKELGSTDIALTAELRQKALRLFERIATILEVLAA